MGGASKLLMLLSIPFPLLHPRPVALRLARHSKLAAFTSLRTTSTLNSPHRLPSPLPHFHAQAAVRDDGGGGYTLESPTLGGGAGAGDSRHPWPEWMRLVDHITAGGYLDRRVSVGVDGGDDSFSGFERLPEEFVRAANACLSFARERPELLRLLSKKDVEVVVENGPPFLFKNALNSSRRMRAFLGGEDSSVMNDEKAETVDVMQYLLGYVCDRLVSSGENYTNAMELVEASVRNLFGELVGISGSFQSPNFTESTYRQELSSFEQPPRYRKSIEMKRGDWICPKCQFMNFAKNMKCLECDEGRPKRQLTGGEWECPQCDFFNYGRNTTCLRCDCKCPEGTQSNPASPASGFGYDRNSNFGEVYNGSNTNKTEIERRLAENDEKAERWFNKVSQLGDTSDLSNVIADEDFPEIMPLRKGVNRFVVSTRKTPLERRLANDQYRRNMVGDGSAEGSGSGTTTESTISSTLDRILGQSSVAQRKNDNASPSAAREINAGTGSSSPQRRDPGSVPFVPLPADMFRKPSIEGQQSSENVSSTGILADPSNESEPGRSESGKPINTSLSDMPGNLTGSKREEMVSANSDGNFPDIMPIRRGENRFVISKKKDRSLTSPQYKRRLAMEQTNSSKFVPFVPFPPGYFAKKDTQSEAGDFTTKAESARTTSLSENTQNIPENFSDRKSSHLKSESLNVDSHHESQLTVGDGRSSGSFGREWDGDNVNSVDGRGTNSMSCTNKTWNNKGEAQRNHFVQQDGSGRLNHAGILNPSSWNNNYTSWSDGPSMNSARSSPPLSQTNNDGNWRNGSNRGEDSHGTCANERSIQPSRNSNRDNQGSLSFPGSNSNSMISAEKTSQRAGTSQNARHGWNGGFTGKSLEGSAVTEPDPLDMSEEAKAQRWFRRVAQITDISELSKIPDEDFPEIMPMRKGVNRFVVSKRKTPLERRLTSPQYRRNLPIVGSEPEKDSKRGNA